MPATHLQLLIARSEADPIESFHADARRAFGDAAAHPAISHLAVCLVEGDAAEIPTGDVTREPAFDAVIDAIVESPAARDHLLGSADEIGGVRAYRVDERLMSTYPRTWKNGAPTPGIVMVSPSYRAARQTAESFSQHWLENHGPLALRHHTGMWDYRQFLVREALTPASSPFDGIAWMGFPDLESFRTGLFDSPEGMRMIMEDTKVFLDLPRSESAILRETILKSTPR